MEIKPIAFAESCYHDKFGTPRQSGRAPAAKAYIQFESEYQPEIALQGLEDFSHLFVIFQFHKNNTARYHAKVHPPRFEGKALGVFATRTPHRPNPLGLTIVKIESIDAKGVHVSGVDFIDKTPIIDIKPYIPQYDSRPDAKSGWLDRIQRKHIEVVFTENASVRFKDYVTDSEQDYLHTLIQQTIQDDPRPLVYRGYESETDPKYREEHAVRIEHLDVWFRFTSANHAEVFDIKLLKK